MNRPMEETSVAETSAAETSVAETSGDGMLGLPRLGLLGAAVAGSGVLLVLLFDGPVAAGALVALLVAVAVLAARYVAGAGALDSAYRDEVRLLRTRAPGMGEWRRNVGTSTGPDGALYYRAVLRTELRRLYAAALAEHHHVSLEHQPERAAELIGPELWPWLGPVPPGTGPDGEVPLDVLRRLVDRLEALGSPGTPGTRTPSTSTSARTPRTGKDQVT